MKILLLLLASVIVLLIGLRLLFGHFNMGSQALRINDTLQPCPESPNCHMVSVNIADSENQGELMERLLESVNSMPGSRVMQKTSNYLHVVFTSTLLGFKDDLECLVETTIEGSTTLHCKSASRVGYSDFGINRKRVDQLLEMASIRQPS